MDTTGCPRTHFGANEKWKSMARILRGGKGVKIVSVVCIVLKAKH